MVLFSLPMTFFFFFIESGLWGKTAVIFAAVWQVLLTGAPFLFGAWVTVTLPAYVVVGYTY